MNVKAGRVPEGTATRIARLRPDDPRLPRAKSLHAVVRRMTGWTKGKFGDWDTLTEDDQEWWIQQWLFVMDLYR